MSVEPDNGDVRRILVIDDNAAIHDDFRKILVGGDTTLTDELATLESKLFDQPVTAAASRAPATQYTVDCASQGEAGCGMAAAAVAAGRPYQLAFVDMRMPPGWDGVQTIEQLWMVDPEIQTVICSAYSDYSWSDIRDRLGASDRLLILKKPFDPIEISQLAAALTEKHRLARAARMRMDQLETLVEARTQALKQVNERLETEVMQRRRAEEQLRHDVLHDRLTGLPNRAMLTDRIEQCIKRKRRDPSLEFAVLFIDVDDFKVVNDSLGHEAGDKLLVALGERLSGALRETDLAVRFCDGIASRLGGDEFVVLLDGLRHTDDALMVARRIEEAVSRPFDVGGDEVVASLSIGVASSREDYESAADILRDADTAVYRAKGAGKRGVAVFNAVMHAEAVERLRLETDLRNAVGSGQFIVHYQPIVSLRSGNIEGLEALVRWQHPTRGHIGPNEFIPLAETCGLILPLGMQVLRTACADLARWRAQVPALANLWVSVNLSGKQLHVADLPEQVDRVLGEAGLPRSALRLEVTESTIMQQGDVALATAARLQERQLALSLDDFGTGYSSLSHLHELPISCIKVDRSFVHQMDIDGRAFTATVQAIVTLAHNCGFSVVAEGIETDSQLVQLQALDCDLAQGFYFSRPLPAEQIVAFLTQCGTARPWLRPLSLAG